MGIAFLRSSSDWVLGSILWLSSVRRILASLRKAISDVACHGFDIDRTVSTYLEWLKVAFRVVLVGWNEEKAEFEYSHFRSPKRGDWRYARRVSRRFDRIKAVIPNVEFFKYGVRGHVESPFLMLSLTYDRVVGLERSWRSVGFDLNRALSFLRKKYGSISVARVWECHVDGFPHVHALILFHGHVFKGFSHVGKNGKLQYRAFERDDIKGCWRYGHVDVVLLASSRAGFSYAGKYLQKSIKADVGASSKSVKTLACCWLFRKRSFGLSGSWAEAYDLIEGVYSNSNREVPFFACLDGSRLHCAPTVWELFAFYKGDHVLIKGESGSLSVEDIIQLEDDVNFRLAGRFHERFA
jgi:hypothetical protein